MRTLFTLNGRQAAWDHEDGAILLDELRKRGYVSVRDGCDGEGSCGLCSVLLDGRLVNSCQILVAQADDREIVTVEHYRSDPVIGIIQQALIDASCVQCGYCTPAVVLALRELLDRGCVRASAACETFVPSEAEIRDALSGTLCRCTGYQQFFEAARLAAQRLSDPAYRLPEGVDYRPDLRHIGKDREKVDAEMLARGERAYVEDRAAPGTCHLALLLSPHAHAWVASVDPSRALLMPGVIEVLSWANTPDKVYTTAGQGFPEPSPHDQRMFPRKVRYVGDRVAAVLAETKEQAEAALSAIDVRYEVLPPLLSIAEAAAPGAPMVHSGRVSCVSGELPEGVARDGDGRDDPVTYQFPIGAHPAKNVAASVHGGIGDVGAGFAEAEACLERTYKAGRVQCTPLEPHSVLAKSEGGRIILHASTQVPWHVRRIVARALGLPENKVRVIKERVGGGFGAKQDIVVEDIAAYMAWKTGRTVLFRFDRAMEFVASRTRHAMEITVKIGAKRDGTLTAIHMGIKADTGPYGQHCLTVPMNAVSKSLPLVLCPNAAFEVITYYTNLPVAGAYQGYGAPKGSFALQTALAELARELGMDPLDLLEKNRVRSGSRLEILKSLGEGRPGAAVTLGECGLGEMLARGRADFGWEKPLRQPNRAGWRRGRAGVIIQQGSGLPGLDAANAELRLLADGTVLLLSGGADLGTGLDTVTAKAAAELLGLDLSDITVISGDTDTTPFDKGAYASSGTFFSGNAALRAAEDLRDKCLAAAAALLGEPTEDLAIVHRGTVRGKKGQVTLAELAHRSVQGEGHHELSGYGHFKTEHAAFPYGAHFCQVLVHERTGEVVVERFRAYQDCGTPINPGLAKGQVYGGMLKAIGHTLYEAMPYDCSGRPLALDFSDYKIPSIYEVPEDFAVEFVPVADSVGPFGAKSVAEISVNGAAPAIAIAIHDAVGAWCREWPFTPERVREAIARGKA